MKSLTFLLYFARILIEIRASSFNKIYMVTRLNIIIVVVVEVVVSSNQSWRTSVRCHGERMCDRAV